MFQSSIHHHWCPLTHLKIDENQLGLKLYNEYCSASQTKKRWDHVQLRRSSPINWDNKWVIISVWSQLMYQVMVGQCSDDRQSSKIQLKSSTFSGQNWSCSASYNCLKLREILKNLIGNRVVVPVWKFILPAPLEIREKITFSLPMVNRILTNHWAMDKPIYWPTISYKQPQLHTDHWIQKSYCSEQQTMLIELFTLIAELTSRGNTSFAQESTVLIISLFGSCCRSLH